MNNNFQEYNEKEYNNVEKNEKKKRIRNKVTLFIVLLIVCFFSTYFIVDRLTNSKNKDVNDNQSKTTVYNTNSLSDDMKIILKVDGIVETSETLKEFKLDNNIDNVNEQFLVDYYASKGYSVESLSEKKVVLNKDEEVILEPNKYYLGEKDGYFAIYKSDENGKVFIEGDVYRSSKMVNTIPKDDQEAIKSFKFGYDTKDEAKEILSGYIS